MTAPFSRLAACALAILIASPLFAASPATPKTDMARLATELEFVLGAGHVEVTRPERPHRIAPPAPPVAVSNEDMALIDAMNREREAKGLAPLHVSSVLTAAAADRVHDMFAKHYFNHVSPDGVSPFTWAVRRGYDYRDLAENLAIGYPRAADVVDGWMHSPGHRRNLLGERYDEVGVAIAHGSPTENFAGPLVVAIYGAQLGE